MLPPSVLSSNKRPLFRNNSTRAHRLALMPARAETCFLPPRPLSMSVFSFPRNPSSHSDQVPRFEAHRAVLTKYYLHAFFLLSESPLDGRLPPASPVSSEYAAGVGSLIKVLIINVTQFQFGTIRFFVFYFFLFCGVFLLFFVLFCYSPRHTHPPPPSFGMKFFFPWSGRRTFPLLL